MGLRAAPLASPWRWLWLALWLAGLPAATPLFSSCTPKYRGRLCSTCTQSQMESAIKPCLPAYNYHVEGSLVVFNQSQESEYGLGNHLGQYFQARGVALLAGMDFEARPPFRYQNIQLPSWVPAVRRSRQFARVPELEHYCRKCPSDTPAMFQRWFHTCMAAWMVVNIREELTAAIRLATPRYTPRDVVIQFRCGDSHKHPVYGMLPFKYYREALAPHLNNTNGKLQVAILPDPDVPREPFCVGLVKAIRAALNFTFGVEVEVLTAASLLADLSVMMNARVFLSSVSSLGFWAAMGSRGKAYLPVHSIMVGGQKPCLNNISWIRTPIVGCSPYYAGDRSKPENIHTWFADSPALQQVVQRAVHTP
eukprot:EG_transcript_13805